MTGIGVATSVAEVVSGTGEESPTALGVELFEIGVDWTDEAHAATITAMTNRQTHLSTFPHCS
jgi:hypothetical protein